MFLSNNIRQTIAMTLHNLHALYNDRGAFCRIVYYDDFSGGIYVVNEHGTEIRYAFSVARHATDPNIVIVKLHDRQRSLRYTR